MESLGCEIGNHTYAHTDLTSLKSADEINKTIWETDEAIAELTGHGATVVRPPYGAYNELVQQTVDRPLILWSVDTLDWDDLDRRKTQRAIVTEAYDGAILLMHDLFETTVEAVERAIPSLAKQGYQFVTVHELAQLHGVELHYGVPYGDFAEE